MKNSTKLAIGILLSTVLLIALAILQSLDAKFLQLEVHWIALAIAPVVVALFAGGFITRFKGFGLELETALQTPVASLNLTASDAVADIPGDEKRSFSYLDTLSKEKKLAVNWLLLRSGRQHFYTANGIETYVRELPNIKYFEVRSEADEFICFLPMTIFRDESDHYGGNLRHDKMQQLIEAIEKDCVPDSFRGSTITLQVQSNQSLVEVLRKMRLENADFAAVMSPGGQYLGVLFASEVEKRIAESVLNAKSG